MWFIAGVFAWRSIFWSIFRFEFTSAYNRHEYVHSLATKWLERCYSHITGKKHVHASYGKKNRYRLNACRYRCNVWFVPLFHSARFFSVSVYFFVFVVPIFKHELQQKKTCKAFMYPSTCVQLNDIVITWESVTFWL